MDRNFCTIRREAKEVSCFVSVSEDKTWALYRAALPINTKRATKFATTINLPLGGWSYEKWGSIFPTTKKYCPERSRKWCIINIMEFLRSFLRRQPVVASQNTSNLLRLQSFFFENTIWNSNLLCLPLLPLWSSIQSPNSPPRSE